MGKYSIGARVRDVDGDEGVIIAKSKGERKVRYDGGGPIAVTGVELWWPKDRLTVIEAAAPAQEGIRLEVGKSYIDRDGKVHGPLTRNDGFMFGDSHPFAADGRSWKANGQFSVSRSECNWDLIAEAPAAVDEPKFKVGDRVRCTNDTQGPFNLIGTIDAESVGSWDVRFDDLVCGHSGDADDGSEDHWYLEDDDLELVSTATTVAAPAATEWVPKVGDRVRFEENYHRRSVGDEDVITAVRPAFDSADGYLVHTEGGHAVFSKRLSLIPPLTIEAGKFYRTRDGRKVGPAVASEWGQPWMLRDGEGADRGYNDDGSWMAPDDESRHDLVAEWVEEPAVQAGDRPRSLDRETIERLLEPSGHHGLIRAFVWESTNQGQEFWAEQHEHGLNAAGRAVLTEWLATAPAPLPTIGSRVTLTGTVTGHIDPSNVNVVVDGVPAHRNSQGLPASALRAA